MFARMEALEQMSLFAIASSRLHVPCSMDFDSSEAGDAAPCATMAADSYEAAAPPTIRGGRARKV